MLHIAIVEDDSKDLERIIEYIEQYAAENQEPMKSFPFANAEVFFENYNPIYDVVFLDIQMPGMNGMEAAERLRALDSVVSIVFITNMSNYAVKGYAVNALDFVVKPVSYYNFATMLTRVIRVASTRADELLLKTPKGRVKVLVDDIAYVEALGHQIIYHLENDEIKLWETLKQQEEKLPKDRFVRCSNYCLVNLRHIDGVQGNTISVAGTEITITRTQKQKFMQNLLDYYGVYF